MELVKPSLTELTTKYYIRNSLKEVRIIKDKYISIFANVFLFSLFILVIGGLLYYKYKGKLTPAQEVIKNNIKKQYIFDKLHRISYQKQKERQSLITNLPYF